jgi:hypothetical protein
VAGEWEAVSEPESIITTRPDPTERVLQAVNDAVHASRELLESKIETAHQVNTERFKAVEGLIVAAKDISNERFKLLIDKMDADRRSDKDNTNTAFTAANAASDKQEKSFIKLLDTLGATVTDLKDRIVVMEGKSSVADPATSVAIHDLTTSAAALKATLDTTAGRREKGSESGAMIFAVIASFAALALVVVDLFGVLKR